MDHDAFARLFFAPPFASCHQLDQAVVYRPWEGEPHERARGCRKAALLSSLILVRRISIESRGPSTLRACRTKRTGL